METKKKMNKRTVSSLSINALAKNQFIKEYVYSQLLKGVYDNSPFLVTDKENVGELVAEIMNNIDWSLLSDSTYGEDVFFNDETYGLYTSLKNDLQKNYDKNDYKNDIDWENHYWNDSVAELIKLLYLRIDPKAMKEYERSGFLIEKNDEDGVINLDYLKAAIQVPKEAIANFRIIDIIDADAGNSFVPEDDIYCYYIFFDEAEIKIKINKEEEKTIVYKNTLVKNEASNIFARIKNENKATGADLNKLTRIDGYVVTSGNEIAFLNLNNNIIYDCSFEIEKSQIFKVVENPWVVPWYNIDGNTYKKVRGQDKKLSALTNENNLDFTREKRGDIT